MRSTRESKRAQPGTGGGHGRGGGAEGQCGNLCLVQLLGFPRPRSQSSLALRPPTPALPCLGLTDLPLPPHLAFPVFTFTLYFYLPFPLAHLHPCLPTAAAAPLCGINTVVADPLPPACGGRGHTAHAQPARRRDAVIGTCQTAAAHFRKSTGALLVLLLAGAAHPSFWRLLGLHATPARAQLSPQDSPHSSSAPGATPLQGVVPAPSPHPAGGARALSLVPKECHAGGGWGQVVGCTLKAGCTLPPKGGGPEATPMITQQVLGSPAGWGVGQSPLLLSASKICLLC